MILVTLGTQDKSFKRLLDAIQKAINDKVITDRVVVQAGYTKYESKDMEIFDLIPMDKFDELIKDCDLLITHGGVGSIIAGLKNDKKVIAAARLQKYGEHTNDHQLQIIKNFSELGYILSLDDFDDLKEVINKSKKFKPKKYKSNTKNVVNLIDDYIEDNNSKYHPFIRLSIIITLFICMLLLIIKLVG